MKHESMVSTLDGVIENLEMAKEEIEQENWDDVSISLLASMLLIETVGKTVARIKEDQ